MGFFTGASDALQAALIEREVRRRQQMLDAFAQQERLRNAAKEAAELDLRQKQEARVAGDSQRNFDALQYQREDDRLARQADDDIPGDVIDQATAALRQKHGFGGTMKSQMLPKANLVVDASGHAPGVSPEEQARQEALPSVIAAYQARGGAKYLQAQAAQQARADQLKAQQEAATQRQQDKLEADAARAREHDDTLRVIAAGNQSMHRDVAATAQDAKAQREADKKAEKDKADSIARQSALSSIDETEASLDELIDQKTGQLKPGVSGTAGIDSFRSYIPGTDAANASASLSRLRDQLVVGLMGELKRQSRTGATGFGALSEKELAILQDSAAKLSTRQSDEALRQELIRLRGKLSGMRQRAGGGAPAGAPSAAPEANIQTRTIRNPKTGETRTQTSTDGGKTWK